MVTQAAARSCVPRVELGRRVVHIDDLLALGWSRGQIRSQVAALRWRSVGRAVVLHNGALSRSDTVAAVLANAGPRAVLTSFTAAEGLGLTGWFREPVHVLVPGGTTVRAPKALPVRVHYTGDWATVRRRFTSETAPGAVLRAAASFPAARPACGLLAAAVQQRLVTAAQLRDALEAWTRIRHRSTLLLAVEDIGQGAHALSEMDFARLCRRAGLPQPKRQRVRLDRRGRRRYLDVEWDLPDGRRVVVEVDGALHMRVDQWWDDQVRQNDVMLDRNVIVLRFPSVLVRTDPGLVLSQLRAALA